MIASIILVMHFLGAMSLETAIISLYVSAIILFIAEFAVVSLGLLSVNALLALYAAIALQTGDSMLWGLDIGWTLLFAIAIVEFTLLAIGFWVWRKMCDQKIQSGIDVMVGQKATVVSWNGMTGKVKFEGEVWQARSNQVLIINPENKVTISGIEKLTLVVNI